MDEIATEDKEVTKQKALAMIKSFFTTYLLSPIGVDGVLFQNEVNINVYFWFLLIISVIILNVNYFALNT